MKNQQKTTNYDYFIKTNTADFKGQWVAIADKKIVAHGKDAEKVYKEAKRKQKTSKVSLAKIPDEQMMVLRFRLP